MSAGARFGGGPRRVVRIERADGSRTYKGPWTPARCEKEAQAWRDAFPTYTVAVIDYDDDTRRDIAAWHKATRREGWRYYPKAAAVR